MSLFVDASAIVAMLAREPEASALDHRLGWEPEPITSALAIWEATRGLAQARRIDFDEARRIVAAYVTAFGIRIVPIGTEEGQLALDAHQRYGRGLHRASLNFGDCFAYACSKRHADGILFKGKDFIHTDLTDAMLW